MSNDEQPWPGPSWSFTVHEGGFPPMNAPGDLYKNLSGLMYLNTGKGFVPLTQDEWDELLDDDRSIVGAVPETIRKSHRIKIAHIMTPFGSKKVSHGDLITNEMTKAQYLVDIQDDDSVWLINKKNGLSRIVSRVRENE